jgi:predicted DCC family thiol-disulfide oxidoreductase YuxK
VQATLEGLPAGTIILVMDGDCALCSWGARLIARHDRDDVFRIATVQSETGARLLTEHGLDPGDPWSWLMIADGEALTGSDAIVRAGRHLDAPWGFVAPLGRITPRFIREPLYRFVARNRIAWFGREDLCALPDPALHAKLLS